MIQRFQGRGPGAESTAARPLSLEEPLDALTARIAEPDEFASDGAAPAENALRALSYHDGLALIAQVRRGLHAARRLAKEMLELATAASWPAAGEDQRANVQLDLRHRVAELRELVSTTAFRGVRLMNGECPMLGLQAGPDAYEYLVLGLFDARPEAMGLEALDVCSSTGARTARQQVRAAIEALDFADEIVVRDLHELLDGARAGV